MEHTPGGSRLNRGGPGALQIGTITRLNLSAASPPLTLFNPQGAKLGVQVVDGLWADEGPMDKDYTGM